MTRYTFFDFTGRELETIETDAPERHTGELSVFYGVDSDEIEWLPTDELEDM